MPCKSQKEKKREKEKERKKKKGKQVLNNSYRPRQRQKRKACVKNSTIVREVANLNLLLPSFFRDCKSLSNRYSKVP
jgi:hypothetical protein